jgi:hypothetical protein
MVPVKCDQSVMLALRGLNDFLRFGTTLFFSVNTVHSMPLISFLSLDFVGDHGTCQIAGGCSLIRKSGLTKCQAPPAKEKSIQ